MYGKVYISRMEMTQKIHFWNQKIAVNNDFLRKWQKVTFWSKRSKKWTGYNTQF